VDVLALSETGSAFLRIYPVLSTSPVSALHRRVSHGSRGELEQRIETRQLILFKVDINVLEDRPKFAHEKVERVGTHTIHVVRCYKDIEGG
jgi:hypothetical protein